MAIRNIGFAFGIGTLAVLTGYGVMARAPRDQASPQPVETSNPARIATADKTVEKPAVAQPTESPSPSVTASVPPPPEKRGPMRPPIPTPEMRAKVWLAKGRELFVHEWRPGSAIVDKPTDAPPPDGLGPLYNGTSCAECHSQGALGGGGPVAKNVVLRRQSHLTEMVHRFGVSPRHVNWRAVMLGQKLDLAFPIVKPAEDRKMSDPVEYSERNATALFGVGLIDAIPEAVLLEVEKNSLKYFPNTLRYTEQGMEGERGGGRLNRLHNRALGRFGWKGQTATLRAFTAAACAMELGLNHTEGRQSFPEYDERPRVAGEDLNEEEFDGLVAFVASLPAPRQALPATAPEQEMVELGQARFTEIGCAECHLPNIGNVAGIYSDLLLHSMGQELSGWGTDAGYGGQDRRALLAMQGHCGVGRPEQASPEEWRTPPLWGCRDSAPYLHDGRAPTLEQAIELHGGQGQRSADRYRQLPAEHQAQLLAFLRSLGAPR